MNQFLKIKLKKDKEYKVVVTNPGEGIDQSFSIATGNNPANEYKLVLKK